MTDGREPIHDIVVIASQRVIGITTYLVSIEHPDWSQWSKYGGVANISMDACHVYEGTFDIKMQFKRDDKCVNLKKV